MSNPKYHRWYIEEAYPGVHYQKAISHVYFDRQTRFQKVEIVEMPEYGKALIIDGYLQSATKDEYLYHEPLIHPACVYHGAPRSALILGGGEGATARELLKWNSMERVVMVDIDGELVGACKEFLPEMHAGAFDDVRSELIIGDAIDYLDHCKDRFDIVVCDLSDPVENSPAANFYTKEYILKCKSVLEENGYLIVQACAVDPLDIAPHARMVNTVSSVFNEVASYGSFVPVFDDVWGFIIAGDQKIDRRPVPEDIDGILAIGITGNLRMFDGTTLLGMMQLPKHVRLAIHENTEIYTLDDKPEVWNY